MFNGTGWLKKADQRLITPKQAAQQTGLGERQLRRLLAKLRSQGDRAVIHAARGQKRAKRRAVVAVARKLAVVLPAMWRKYEAWQPIPNGEPAAATAAGADAAQ